VKIDRRQKLGGQANYHLSDHHVLTSQRHGASKLIFQNA